MVDVMKRPKQYEGGAQRSDQNISQPCIIKRPQQEIEPEYFPDSDLRYKHNSSHLGFPALRFGSSVTSYPFPSNRKRLKKKFYWNKSVGWETALLGMRGPPAQTHTHTETNNSSKMHVFNCIKCGQLALFSRPTAVTRFDTCNCTVRYLNKECGGLPMPREQKKKLNKKRKQHDSNKEYIWMYPVVHRLSLLRIHHKQHNTSTLLPSSFLFLFT